MDGGGQLVVMIKREVAPDKFHLDAPAVITMCFLVTEFSCLMKVIDPFIVSQLSCTRCESKPEELAVDCQV